MDMVTHASQIDVFYRPDRPKPPIAHIWYEFVYKIM